MWGGAGQRSASINWIVLLHTRTLCVACCVLLYAVRVLGGCRAVGEAVDSMGRATQDWCKMVGEWGYCHTSRICEAFYFVDRKLSYIFVYLNYCTLNLHLSGILCTHLLLCLSGWSYPYVIWCKQSCVVCGHMGLNFLAACCDRTA